MEARNIVSVSGGKDSTALLLLAIERQAENMEPVFMDTAHEHQITYEYIEYLSNYLVSRGLRPIRRIKADFSDRIAGKREYIARHWVDDLMRGLPGAWEWEPFDDEACAPASAVNPLTGEKIDEPATPDDPYRSTFILRGFGRWVWSPATRPMSHDEAQAKVGEALEVLHPTGVPFLDLCLWKGRFPSTRARFCSEELKRNPAFEQVHMPLMEAGAKVVSWQGVRADESVHRAKLPELECVGASPDGGELWNYRPILQWKASQCFDMHRKYGVKHNPLYEAGMGRVGCMPCIHARKNELLEIAKRYPDEFERVSRWERLVSSASKRGCSTFFEADTINGNSRDMASINHKTHGILSVVEWAKTSRGGRQYDLLRSDNENVHLCSSMYGLCE